MAVKYVQDGAVCQIGNDVPEWQKEAEERADEAKLNAGKKQHESAERWRLWVKSVD